MAHDTHGVPRGAASEVNGRPLTIAHSPGRAGHEMQSVGCAALEDGARELVDLVKIELDGAPFRGVSGRVGRPCSSLSAESPIA